jgi:outer membrane protein TolC
MKPSLFWILPLPLVIGQIVTAEPPATKTTPNIVTVNMAVNQALLHSPTLKSRSEDTHAASARRSQANSELFPKIDARFQGMHFTGLENTPLAPTVTIPEMYDQYSASIGATQPIFTGGRITAQRQGARFSEAACHANESAATANTILQALNAYWQWSKAVYLVESLEDAVRRTDAQTLDTRNKKEAGAAMDSDLLAAEVLLDQTKLHRDDARRQADMARIELNRRMRTNVPPDARPSKPIAPVATPGTLEDNLACARTNRQELIALEKEVLVAESKVKMEQAGSIPQVALVARYEYGNPNIRDFPPVEEWEDDAYIGATASWNIFDGGFTRNRVSEARIRARQARLTFQDAEEGVCAQVEQTLLSLQHALSKVNTAIHAETSASRNVKVTSDLCASGMARHSELLDAQSKLTEAAYQRIASEADAVLAEANFRYAVGLLTQESFNVIP